MSKTAGLCARQLLEIKQSRLVAVMGAIAEGRVLQAVHHLMAMYTPNDGWLVRATTCASGTRVQEVGTSGVVYYGAGAGLNRAMEMRRIASLNRHMVHKGVMLQRVVEGTHHGADLVLLTRSRGMVLVEVSGPLGRSTIRQRMWMRYGNVARRYGVFCARQRHAGGWQLYELTSDKRLTEVGWEELSGS